jgi:CHAT domain-containing protein
VTAIKGKGQLKHYNHSRLIVKAILEWLWDAAVEPVLDCLGLNKAPPNTAVQPRVWWVASGLLNLLPIHAAGYHDTTPPKSAFDCVISSYTPTIKALSYARERARRQGQLELQDKALLISMPTTPDEAPLPKVEVECTRIKQLLTDASIPVGVMEKPHQQEVFSTLSAYNIVHFACHGRSKGDPSQSCPLFEDWKTMPLTVSDLLSLKLEFGTFAYLSACQTYATEDISLLDESRSLSSAIQLLRYPSVIGSLWDVDDQYSVSVSTTVYQSMLGGGDRGRGGAEGLHNATRHLT